ncbi:C4-dicarboxylate ABC transporter permease [Devosia yakushimensis]|uniref:TRAP transporter small permease protein n=1 Tax=Devosia yakushimensis TaxID=470028 RepID=A0ABQ5UH52_9HYPH|nr:TRAP transporter small permease subunit [Devosia yakushimensis]GLQ09896.1 C4-dicarboxylate ABC transporter permease [Devosia yakushimensis]
MGAASTLSVSKGITATLESVADWLSLIAAFLAAACIVALTGLILAEIVVALLARFIPAVPSGIGIGWEYSAYLMGGAFLLGSGMTLRAGQQIRVELLLRARNGRYARYLEIASALLGSVITVFLAITLVQFTYRTFLSGEVSQDSFTPLWIPQVGLSIGATVLALQMIVRTIISLTSGQLDRPELGAATQIEG